MVDAAGVDAAAVRAELRSWLDVNWDPDLSLLEWRTRLVDARWACPTWPSSWFGRGWPIAMGGLVAEELERVGAPGLPEGVGGWLAAPTILEHGSDDVKERFLRRTLTGELSWCQLFSEPGAGSDLAGLTTHAVRDGDTWIVSGQKVWNTSAHHADHGMLLARTNWDAHKHGGITYFALPMRQPGVEVRPLRQMNGYQSFNEVFLDEARVSADDVVGAVDGGWTVALATLAHERRLSVHRARLPTPEHPGRAVREAMEEHAVAHEPYRWYPQRAGRPDLLVEHAVKTGRDDDPIVRQEIVRTLSLARVAEWTAARAATGRALGRPPGPEGSLGKLAGSSIARASARTHALIARAAAMTTGGAGAYDGLIAEILLSVPAGSIAGGTDEIQHNILGERILGLPREPDPAKDQPFRDALRPRSGEISAAADP